MGLLSAFERRAGGGLPQSGSLRSDIRRRNVASGQSLFDVGDHATDVYFVCDGIFKLSYLSDDGQERVRDFVGKGQVFACIEALDGEATAGYAAVACEDSEVEYFSAAKLAALAETSLAWSRCVGLFYLDTALHRGGRERQFLMLPPRERYLLAIEERA